MEYNINGTVALKTHENLYLANAKTINKNGFI